MGPPALFRRTPQSAQLGLEKKDGGVVVVVVVVCLCLHYTSIEEWTPISLPNNVGHLLIAVLLI